MYVFNTNQKYRAAENNYQPYCNEIKDELTKNGVQSFLKRESTISMFGLSKEYGRRYACQLVLEFPKIVERMNGELRDAVLQFQSVGGSEEYLYPGFEIQLTPYTTRYLYQACIITDYLYKKYNKVHIIEIGGGFGGLAYWIQTLTQGAFPYTIIDLEEPRKLQDACLKEWKAIPLTDSTNGASTLFLISNYAYSEFNAQVQEHYKKNIIEHVDGGFMIWNNLTGITQFTQKEMKIEPERPSFPNNDNKFIYF